MISTDSGVLAESRMVARLGARVSCPTRCPVGETPALPAAFELSYYPNLNWRLRDSRGSETPKTKPPGISLLPKYRCATNLLRLLSETGSATSRLDTPRAGE